jgi:type IX secretion system PorP/SprF family membrane protein
MKKLIIILTGIVTCGILNAQQIPLSENYFSDKYSLSPSYAGNYNTKFLFTGYRSDWSGIDGGPRTLRVSYNDVLMSNAGYGGKIIYDKAGIFSQLYIMGSYSYHLEINKNIQAMFGLSGGFYKNRLNLLDYYSDPTYTLDPSLVSQDISSKLKFMSDFSFVLLSQGVEAGFMFSNISFGDASYKAAAVKYNPLSNFQFHISYVYSLNEQWDLSPLFIIRSGKYIRSQFEVAAQVKYMKKFYGSIVYRDPGVFGFGIGANIGKGLIVAYNFNLATNVTLGAFNNHEVCLGVNLFEYLGKSK